MSIEKRLSELAAEHLRGGGAGPSSRADTISAPRTAEANPSAAVGGDLDRSVSYGASFGMAMPAGGADLRNLPTKIIETYQKRKRETDECAAVFAAFGESEFIAQDAHRRALVNFQVARARYSDADVFLAKNGAELPELRPLLDEIEETKIDLERRRVRKVAAAERRAAAQNTIDRIEEYLRWVKGIEIKAHALVPPPLKKGQTAASAVETLRSALDMNAAEKHDIESRPCPSVLIKQLKHDEIDAIAKSGAPRVAAAIETADEISWPTAMIQGRYLRASQIDFQNQPDTFRILVWLMRDQLIARINAEIDEVADDDRALSDAQRAEKLAQVAAERLELERREEFFVTMANEEGAQIPRRGDADVRAIIGLDDSAPPWRERPALPAWL